MFCDSSEGLSKVSSIAAFYQLPEQFLQKILQTLTKAGLVETVRGRNGGIRLARPAATITVGEIIRVTEDNFALAECLDDGETDCPHVNACGLNRALSEALNAFFEVLDEYTLEDLTNNRSNIGVLMQLEASKHIPLN